MPPRPDAPVRGGVALAISHSEAAGTQAIWADLGAELRNRGHLVRMIALYPGRHGAMALPDGLEWYHCLPQPPRSPLDAVRAGRRVMHLLDTWVPEAILTALPAANLIFALANARRRVRARAITSHHSPAFTYNRLLDRLDGWAAATPAVDCVVCVSAAVRDSLLGKLGRYHAKTIIIANALPPPVEQLIDTLRRQQDAPVPGRLIACGRLAPQKNYPVLIRAMQWLPDTSLSVVGIGPDEQALRQLAAACGVSDRVHFLGWRSREETLALMASSDVFVQPSLFEGHSLALIEAAKLGLPLVVSNVPSQAEAVVRRDGTLCALMHEHSDDRGLAACVGQLIADRAERKHFHRLALSLGEESRFSVMVDQYEALISPFSRPLP